VSLFGAYVLNLLLKRRRMAEALVKYQAAMDASIDGIAILDRNHRCIYVNAALAGLYGSDTHADVTGRAWKSFYDSDEAEKFQEEVFPSIRQKGRWRGEATGLRQDGTSFPQDISITAIDEHHMVCIVRDITDRKSVEQLLEARAGELAAANDELEAFSYSLTHDMRNHITRISSAVQLMEEGEVGSAYAAGIIGKTCGEMDALVNGMLVLSHIIQREICREKVDLTELAHAVGDELRMADTSRLVDFNVAPELYAECDRHLLKIALTNLVGNAWKYTGKVEQARVEVGVTEKEGGKVFFVRDNGVGFDMNETQRLFRPFERLDGSQDFPGSGIGLATVQRVIQRHGGRVWAEAEAGRGAVFYFTLPDSSEPTFASGGEAAPAR
ncbi:MAG TPA: ATP-binding protein, partial [Verrucomicrobiae bacterium]|nr:ATP-binding protein [Verrucomicrobiae bacterium]